jgi:hypothetical protein
MPTKQYVRREANFGGLTATLVDVISMTGTSIAGILNVTADSGTSQTLDIKLENLDPLSGNVIGSPLFSHTQVTNATSLPFTEMKVFADTTSIVFTPVLKLTFTLGGTGPSFSFTYELISKGF